MASLVGVGGNYQFNPTSVAGLQMWLDGADPLNNGTTPATGAVIGTWSDKSGNGRNGTGVASPIFVAGGGILLNGTSQCYTTPYTSNPTTETLFIVFKYAAVAGHLIGGGNNVNGSREFYIYPTSTTTGVLYIIGQNGSGYYNSSTINVDTPYVYDYTYTSSGFSGYKNGTIDNANSTVFTFAAGGTTKIGAGGYAGPSNFMNGTIYEVIVYNTSLSANERANVQRYLNNKWNVTLPIVFLRANSFTGSGTWFDQTGNGFNASLAAGSITKNSAKNGVVFTYGSTSYNISNLGLTNAWTLNVWYRKTSPSDTYGFIFSQVYSNNSTNCSLSTPSYPVATDYTMTGTFLDSRQSHHRGTPFSWIQNTWVNAQITWDGSYMKTYINGVLIGTTNTVIPNAVAVDGGTVYSLGLAALNGEVGELRIYRYAITAAQVLADYNSSLGIFPVTTTGPVVLLQAKYYSGIGTWNDTSGYGRNATLAAGISDKNAEGNGIILNGSSYWTFPNVGVGNAWTVNVWFKRTGNATGASACIVTQQYTAGNPNINIFVGDAQGANNNAIQSGFFLNSASFQCTPYGTTPLLPLNTWINIQATWNGSSLVEYVNGSSFISVSSSQVALDGGLAYNIGRRWDSASYMVGEIGEVRIYNYALSATQVLQDYNNSLFMFQQPINNLFLATVSTDTGLTPQTVTTNGTVPYVTVAGYPCAQFTNTANYLSLPLTLQTSYTINLWFYVISYSSTYLRVGGISTAATGTGGTGMNIDINGNGQIIAYYYFSGGQTNINGPYLSAGNWYHFSTTINTSTRTCFLFINGVVYGSATGTGTFPSSKFLLIGKLGTNTTNGYIRNVSVYNSILSQSQIQDIYAQNGQTNFTPGQIPGLQVWLDGADPLNTGVTPLPQTITTWFDKSGKGYNATGVGSPGSVAAGGVYLNGTSQYFTTSYPSISLRETAFIVMTLSAASSQGFNPMITTTNSSSRWTHCGPTYTNYEFFGGGGTSMNATVAISFNIPFLYNYTYSSGSTSFQYFNGSQTASMTSSTVASGAGTTMIGYTSYLSTYTRGTIYEVIIYNRVLSTAERQQVEGYLSWKWGLTLATTQPYYTLPPNLYPQRFTPTNFPSYWGLQMWLDGADPFAGATPTPGGAVATWIDKSGNGRNATGVASPLYVAGGGISFNGSSQYFTTTYTAAPARETAFVVFSSTNPSTAFEKAPIGANNVTGSRGAFVYSSRMYLQQRSVANTLGPGSATIAANTPYICDYTYTSGGLARSFVNGTQDATNSSAAAFSGAGVTYIGNYASTVYFSGTIYEVIIFNTPLIESHRQIVEGYLAWKWGIQGSLPAAHQYYSAPPNSFPSTFSVSQYPGLQLWLDSADNGISTTPGTAITTWSDKSGNGRNATGVGSPTYANGGGIALNGTSQYYTTTYTSVPTTETTFVVINFNSGNYIKDILGSINSSTYGGRQYDIYQDKIITNNYNIAGYPGGATTIPINTTLLLDYTFTSGTMLFYYNGTQDGRTTGISYSGSGNTSIGTSYGTTVNPASFLNATIYEVIIYNTVLTQTQRQTVEGYLAWKWNTQSSLASNHPYKSSPP